MDDATHGDAARLDALRSVGVLDTPPEANFDRLTRLAARALGAPVALVSFVDEHRQYFKSCVGLPEPWASRRETPLSHSFCKHVVASREPLVVEDAREHPLVRDNLAIEALGVVAYLGVPLVTPEGYALGSLCAIDKAPRAWSADDLEVMTDLAEYVMAEIALRTEAKDVLRRETRHRLILDSIRDHAIFTIDPTGNVIGWDVGAENLLGYSEDEIVGRTALILFTDEDRAAEAPAREMATAADLGHAEDTRWHVRKDGSRFFATGVVNSMRDDSGALVGFTKIMRDITHLKHGEEQASLLLRDEQTARRRAEFAEERYGTLIAALPQLVWTTRDDGWCDYLSPQWVVYTGVAEDKQLGFRWLDLVIHPEDREHARSAWTSAFKDLAPYDLEYRIRGGDGRYRWFKTRGVPQKDVSGNVLKWFGTCTDIEDQRAVDEALRVAQAQLRSALDAGAIATWNWDIRNDRIAADETLARLFSVTPSESEKGSLSSYLRAVHPGDREVLAARIAQAVASGERFDEEYRIVQPDDSVIWVVARGKVEHDAEGRPTGLSGVLVDITARKQAEEVRRGLVERMASQSRMFDTALSNTPDLMYVFDLDGRFTYANHALLMLWGRTWDEVIGRDCLGVGYPRWHAERHDREIRLVIATRRPIRGEAPFEAATGRRIYDYIFVPVLGSDGEVEAVAGSARDMTERKRSEEELARLHEREQEARLTAETALVSARAAQAEIESVARAKDQFLAMLSHELRTPINPILLAATARLEESDLLEEEERKTWEMIRDNIGLEARLIDDLLDVMRTITGKMPYQLRVVDLHDLIGKSVAIVRNDAEVKRIGIVTRFDAVRSFVNADPDRLTQAFWNLLNNAIKFTPEGGAITVRTFDDDDRIVAEVRDTGIGIDPEALPKVFNAFEQVEDSVTRRFGGLGLGLAISKSVVEGHGGRLSARSEGRGLGSTFSIELLAVDPVDLVLPDARPAEYPRRSFRLMFVEDDVMTCRVMARLLRNAGHEVTTAVSYESAIEAASPEIDLVISDLGLPGRSGFELMAELKGRYGLRGIALTGFGMQEDIRKGEEAGFVGHVTKPVDFPRLEALIQRIASGENASE